MEALDLVSEAPPTAPDALTHCETEYIKKYRALDGRGKETVDGVLELEYKRVVQAAEVQAG